MPRPSLAVLAVVSALACGSPTVVKQTGECLPPEQSAPLEATPLPGPVPECRAAALPGEIDLSVVGSADEYRALFDPACDVSAPSGVDFATQRVAVAVTSSPSQFKWVAEDAKDVVVGIFFPPSGALVPSLFVIALPRSDKPVRAASCHARCDGTCPPSA